MTILESQEEIVKEFQQFGDWDEKYKYIIDLGRQLPPINELYKTDNNKLSGCQSQVWINAKLEDNIILFEADSDAAIVKGLIALLIKVYSGHSPNEILSAQPDFLINIGIDNHLSPTRKNGLGAMLKQIQMYAIAFKTITDKQKPAI